LGTVSDPADPGDVLAGGGGHRLALSWSGCKVLEAEPMPVALPPLGRDLGLGLAGLEWVVNLYSLTFAVLTLVGGMLVDRYGSKPGFLTGLAVFADFSLAAGLAQDGPALIALRAGAALMAPAALALLLGMFSGSARALALGVWSGAGATALAGGPLFGAVLTDSLGWWSIFLVNVALGPVLWEIARRTLPAPRPVPSTGPLDVAGALAWRPVCPP
jgi:MFS family permease